MPELESAFTGAILIQSSVGANLCVNLTSDKIGRDQFSDGRKYLNLLNSDTLVGLNYQKIIFFSIRNLDFSAFNS